MKSALSEPSSPERLSPTAWGLALAATAVLFAGVLAPPFLSPIVRAPLVVGFHALCHQLPERSFFVDGVQLAACHRCTGIYAGLVLGVLALPLWKRGRAGERKSESMRVPRLLGSSPLRFLHTSRERFVLLVAVIPVALDWGAEVFGLWAGSPASRVATGLWFGLLAGYLFARAVAWTGGRAEAG